MVHIKYSKPLATTALRRFDFLSLWSFSQEYTMIGFTASMQAGRFRQWYAAYIISSLGMPLIMTGCCGFCASAFGSTGALMAPGALPPALAPPLPPG